MIRTVLVALWLASLIAAGWWSYETGREVELASQYREEEAARKAAQVAADAAARAIARIEVKNVTIRQQLEREIHTREVFRDCRSGDDVVRLLNASPGVGSAVAAGGGQLPASAPTR